MMQAAADEGARFIQFFLEPVAQDLVTSRSLSSENMKKLDDLAAGKPGEHMILVKIWLPDATLVYSTNKESIGERFPSRHITAALKGKAAGEFDYLQDAENAADKHLHTSKSMRHCSVQGRRRSSPSERYTLMAGSLRRISLRSG